MTSEGTNIHSLCASIEKLAGQVDLRHGKFEPCEYRVLDGDRACQRGEADVLIRTAELEALPRSHPHRHRPHRHRLADAAGRWRLMASSEALAKLQAATGLAARLRKPDMALAQAP